MPQAKYRIKRVRLWDGKEYNLGTEICFVESSSGFVFLLPYADSGERLANYLQASGNLSTHVTAEGSPDHRDPFDAGLTIVLNRLGSGDLLEGLRVRILGARRFVADPSHLESFGISWLLPIPAAAGVFDTSLSEDILDATFLQPVSVEAPWHAPSSSLWVSFSEESPTGLICSVPFEQSVAVFLIPWYKCQRIIRWFIRQFVDSDGLLPSGEVFI